MPPICRNEARATLEAKQLDRARAQLRDGETFSVTA